MPTITHTAMGYRATRAGDEVRIHDVPIFVECCRGDAEFDAKWVAGAVSAAKQQQRDGYWPPLTIRHHGDAETVIAAGHFEIQRGAPITMKGQRLTAIFADLVLTNPTAAELVLSKRLPYRSVEIFNVDGEPKIDVLSLLDHEPPFHELPMLFVNEIDDGDSPVSRGTFAAPWTIDGRQTPDGLVACFRKGHKAHLLFREDPDMTTTIEKPKDAPAEPFGEGVTDAKGQTFADDEKPKDKDEGEEMEGESLDVSAVVKAITSGEISVKDMDAILAAIQNQKTEAEPEAEDEVAPAAVPGQEAMKADTTKLAKMQGRIDAMEAKDKVRDLTEQRTQDVAAAMVRLAGRPLGADLETKLVAFHTEHGAAAFTAYVESMAQTFGVLPDAAGSAASFQGQAGKVPDVAMKYQAQGNDAVDQAAKFANEWVELKAHGAAVRQSQERYIEINMARVSVQEN